MCSILLKSESYERKESFLPWRRPEIFIILSILLTIASHRQIGSKAFESFEGGPFGRVVEAGLYK